MARGPAGPSEYVQTYLELCETTRQLSFRSYLGAYLDDDASDKCACNANIPNKSISVPHNQHTGVQGEELFNTV